jgi:predicted esterase
VIHHLVDEALAGGMPIERVVLLGFSQGACLAATSGVRRPARYGGVIVLSGGLIGPPGTDWDGQGSFGGCPVFLGCSDPDSHVPRQRVDESAAVFDRMGASVTKRIYPNMGHLVNDDEVAFVREVLSGLGA